MIKTKYTKGFEIFWKTWCGITGKKTDKPEAFGYWKRDKLEGDEDELIRILLLQNDERKRLKDKGVWQPVWCFCRKWLNKRRYEYVPEPPKKRIVEIVSPLTQEEKDMYSPENKKRRAEYRKLVEKTAKNMDVTGK